MRAARALAPAPPCVASPPCSMAPAAGAGRPASPTLSMSSIARRVSTRLGADFRFQHDDHESPGAGAARRASSPTSTSSADDRRSTSIPRTGRRSARATCRRCSRGASIVVPWTVNAVNAGRFSVYVVVLGAGRPVAGPALDARVSERRTLDAGGVLPLALGLPALLGAALLGVRARRPR